MKSILVVIGILACLIVPCSSLDLGPGPEIGGNQGWITIQCNVNGASVYFNGEYKGMISANQLTVPVYTTGTPYTSYSVEKTGYYTATGNMVMPAAGQTRTYTATLQPIPTPAPVYGSIYVESSPSGAAVSLNGNYRGTTPLTINNVYTGSYPVSIEMSGYYPYQTTTTVYAGSTSSVYGSLTPLVSTGNLYVTSDPSGAMVYLDTSYKGKTPLTLNNVATGDHVVELDLSGYYDWKSAVTVPAGGTRTVSATLTRIPTSTTGWIYVASSPGGATVTLDGVNVGQTPTSGSLKLNNIAAGSHSMSLQLTGYQTYTTGVNVVANTVSQVDAVLTPGSVPSAVGGLSVSSTPTSADVYVDNVFRGITPLTLNDVSAGSHTLLLQLSGYNNYASTVQVNSGATNTVAAVLSPVTTPTQKAGTLPVVAGVAIGIIGLLCVFRRN
jgi:hypothetical protein